MKFTEHSSDNKCKYDVRMTHAQVCATDDYRSTSDITEHRTLYMAQFYLSSNRGSTNCGVKYCRRHRRTLYKRNNRLLKENNIIRLFLDFMSILYPDIQ